MSTHGHSRHGKSGNHSHSHRKSKTKNLAGKLIVLVQLLMTVVFIAVVWNSGMVPGKYLAALSVVLVVLFGMLFGMQFIK